MLLKISLGLAILAGLATLYFTSMPLKEKIDNLNASLASETTAKTTALEEKAKAVDDQKKTKAALDTTSASLKDATNLLAVASARLTEQEKRANKASADLTVAVEERNEARQELSRFKGIGIPPEKIIEELAEKKKIISERDALLTDKDIFTRKNAQLEAKIKSLVSEEEPDVPLPAGTKGKVVAVDPKYDFVVIDIGGNQGLLENAKMLVNRGGKLVAKVKITRVEPNRAIANIMPEWKQDDVMEGDQVVY
jgi:hypothetical protein